MNHQYQRVHFGFGARLTPVVKALLIANGVVFLLEMIAPNLFIPFFSMRPRWVWSRFAIWQPFSYMFLHAGFGHLLVNMFVLWMFGCEVERLFGRRRFTFYYFLTGVGAGLTHLAFFFNSDVPVMGASGAVYGILLAFGLYFPNRPIYVFPFFFMPIKAKYWVLIMGALAFFGSISSQESTVAHLAHLGGMVFGFFYIRKLNWIADIQHLMYRWKQRRLRKKYRVYRGGGPDDPTHFPGDDDHYTVH
jgi:membrane associated rhomboid family serine protease